MSLMTTGTKTALKGPWRFTVWAQTQQRSSSLKTSWALYEGDSLTNFRACATGAVRYKRSVRNRRVGGAMLLCPPSVYLTRCLREPLLTLSVYFPSTPCPTWAFPWEHTCDRQAPQSSCTSPPHMVGNLGQDHHPPRVISNLPQGWEGVA